MEHAACRRSAREKPGKRAGRAVPAVTHRFTAPPRRERCGARGSRCARCVAFLPGYYDSLSLFGLSSAVQQVEDGIVQRIQDIYAGYNLEVRLEEPTEFGPTSYATLEIGGPDPNGTGLFGNDNSPGKDVGNLRLFDMHAN